MSPALVNMIGFNSTPSDWATDWMMAHCPIPAAPGSRKTAARVTDGTIYLSSSIHFPLKPYSNWMKPVALPPGRAMLSMYRLPTGSML